MKKKTTITVTVLLLTALLLTGCSAGQKQMEYIGAEKAKELAIDRSGVTPAAVELLSVDMDTKNGIDYYRVGYTVEGTEYVYNVDALTGVIISSSTSVNADSAPSADIPASDSTPTVDSAATGSITAAEAEAIALKHAGLTVEQVTIVRSHFDRDDGRNVYDVEFYTVNGNTQKEYDYEIDAATGKIRDVDYDAEYYKPPQPANNDTKVPEKPAQPSDNKISSDGRLSESEIKAIALAQVPGATDDDIRLRSDYDDGRIEYEGTIIYKGLKYEFDIDGYSGAIRDWDVDSVFDD